MKRSDIDPMPAFFDRYINLVEDIDLLEALELHSPEAIFSDVDTLEALGDSVITGPTLTNVNDFRAILIDAQ